MWEFFSVFVHLLYVWFCVHKERTVHYTLQASTHNHFDSLKLHNAVDAHFSCTLVFKLLRIFDIAIK